MKNALFFLLVFATFTAFTQDLIVTNVSGPVSVARYGALTNQITIKNNGIVAINKYFTSTIYLSTNNVLEKATDVNMGGADLSALNVGESKTLSPNYFYNGYKKITPGSYYLIVEADTYSGVTETDETNNQLIIPFDVTASDVDFSITSFSLDKSTVSVYDLVKPSATIINTGTTNVQGTLYTRFFLSTDATFDASDTKLDFNSWSINNATTFNVPASFGLTISGVTAGNYYLIAVADWITASNFVETNESNNIATQPITITASNIDLEVMPLNGLISSGDMISGWCTIKNNGTTGASGFSIYAIFYQNGIPITTYPVPTGSGSDGYVPAGGTKDFYMSLYPSSFGISGNYTLSIAVNYYYDISETNYGNNEKTADFNVTPTYQAVSMSNLKAADSYDNTDKELIFNVSLSNTGTASYFYQYYDLIIRNSANTIVKSQSFNSFISYPGENKTDNITTTLTDALPAGQYTVELKCSSSCSTTPSTLTTNLTILELTHKVSGIIVGDDGTQLTAGNIFLYEKANDGTVSFVQKISLTNSNAFSFSIDDHAHTLYFIPDYSKFPNHVPTIYGKTVTLDDNSFFTSNTDMDVVFEILSVQALASGAGIISGQVSSGSSSGRIATLSSTAYPVVLLSSTGDVVGFTYADESGKFTFNNLPRDTYQIVVPQELDKPTMSAPLSVNITSRNAFVSIQLSADGVTTSEEVLMLSQNISFSLSTTTSYGADPINLSATSDGGLPVVFSSSDNTIAEVDGNKLIIKGVGDVTITATQGGDDFYSPASKDQTLAISKAEQHIIFGTLSGKSFGDEAFTPDVYSSSELNVLLTSSNPDIASVDNNVITIVGAGTVTITAMQSGNDLYKEASPVSHDLVVAKASQTISFEVLPEKTTADKQLTLSATASSSLEVSFTSDNEAIATVSDNVISIHGAGVVNITAVQNGNQNYEAANSVTRSLTVNAVTGIEISQPSIEVYPNPTTGLVIINGYKKITSLTVIDLIGKTQPVTLSSNNQIDLTGVPQGVYFIRLCADANVYLYKIVRE